MQHSPGHSISLQSSDHLDSGSLISRPVTVKKKPRFYDPWIPYYDAELDVAQSHAHKDVIAYFLPLMHTIGEDLDLNWLSDNPIWYKGVPPEESKIRFADLALARKSTKRTRVNASDLLMVLEVVTTHHPAKRKKDTILQRNLNEQHCVPEFGLIWPELKDKRALNLFRFEEKSGKYREVKPDEHGQIHSQSIPGLSFVVQPREAWVSGQKVVAYYKGVLHQTSNVLQAQRLEAVEEAETQKQIAKEQTQHAKKQELIAKKQTQHAKKQELIAKEQTQFAKEQAHVAAAALAKADKYLELLRLHGIEAPD